MSECLSSSLRLINQLFVLFNIVKEHSMGAIAPFFLRISVNAEVLQEVKAMLHDRINIATEVITVISLFVEKKQQVPI